MGRYGTSDMRMLSMSRLIVPRDSAKWMVEKRAWIKNKAKRKWGNQNTSRVHQIHITFGMWMPWYFATEPPLILRNKCYSQMRNVSLSTFTLWYSNLAMGSKAIRISHQRVCLLESVRIFIGHSTSLFMLLTCYSGWNVTHGNQPGYGNFDADGMACDSPNGYWHRHANASWCHHKTVSRPGF